MKIIRSIKKMKLISEAVRKKGKTIGFVLTMGALHKGHLSLVRDAKKRSDFTVVSIFVNPIQFGPKEDLKRYPRDLRSDLKYLGRLKVDAVFVPAPRDMFPPGFNAYIEIADLGKKLCGASRPGHFRGVATVVAKLFNIVKPNLAFFGLKDFQQQVIIKKMVKDLDMDVKVVSLPTIREKDGLAMSSRNQYLLPGERKSAAAIRGALLAARNAAKKGKSGASKIILTIKKILAAEPRVKIDYVSVCDPLTFEEKNKINGKTLIALAAYIGRTRLIDNIVIA